MPVLPVLGPSGYFVFMIDPVVPDDHRTPNHVNDVRPEDKGRWRAQDVRQDDKRNGSGTHEGETYCQRSNHGGSLAKHQIKGKDQRPKSHAGSEARRRQQLDLLRRRPPQYGQGSQGPGQKAGRDEKSPGSSRDDFDNHPGDRRRFQRDPGHAATVEFAIAPMARRDTRIWKFSSATRARAGRRALPAPAPRRRSGRGRVASPARPRRRRGRGRARGRRPGSGAGRGGRG